MRPRITARRRGPPPFSLLLLLAALPLAGCSGGGDGGAAADSTAAAADSSAAGGGDEEAETEEKAITVDVGTVRRGDLVMPIYADGAIRTPRSVEIRTKVGGELVSVLVRDGDRVRAGQVLARIDPREYAIALEESRYRHLQALSQMAAEADTFTVNHDGPARLRRRPRRPWTSCPQARHHHRGRIPRPAAGSWRWPPCRRAPSARPCSSSAPAWPRPAWPRSGPA